LPFDFAALGTAVCTTFYFLHFALVHGGGRHDFWVVRSFSLQTDKAPFGSPRFEAKLGDFPVSVSVVPPISLIPIPEKHPVWLILRRTKRGLIELLS